jgi:hypothetical protein
VAVAALRSPWGSPTGMLLPSLPLAWIEDGEILLKLLLEPPWGGPSSLSGFRVAGAPVRSSPRLCSGQHMQRR